ncbi:uncharacterized protein LOC131149489 isoform X2 [Malania oleifera]|uniref:uncharacterized protein LOC131149489 isoform X2 n=1 Tax=Malania oleifera TaxID=397392 RepID=UPI0025ADF164|nr:uncharacterized protein LOC131149489 isoform X2 [Malania oleifera]
MFRRKPECRGWRWLSINPIAARSFSFSLSEVLSFAPPDLVVMPLGFPGVAIEIHGGSHLKPLIVEEKEDERIWFDKRYYMPIGLIKEILSQPCTR